MKLTCCLVALLLSSILSFAQDKSPAEAAYLKWRNESLAQRPAGINTPHHAMAVTLTRLDAQTLRLDFALVGKTSSHELLIQPLKTSKLADGQIERRKVGEATTVSIGFADPKAVLPMVLHQVDVRGGEEANAIQITWTYVRDDGPFTSTHNLEFGQATSPVTSVVGIED